MEPTTVKLNLVVCGFESQLPEYVTEFKSYLAGYICSHLKLEVSYTVEVILHGSG